MVGKKCFPKITKRKILQFLMKLATKINYLLLDKIGDKLNKNEKLQHFIVTYIKHFIVCRNEELTSLCTKEKGP